MQITQPESFYSTTLASSINATQATIPVTTAPNITVGYMVIESNTANREIISYTGVTGTTLTGVTRGLASYGSDTSAGTGKAHAAGTDIANRNVHYYYAQYYDFLVGTSATGYNDMKIGDGGTCSATNRTWSVPLSSYTPWWGLSANGKMVVSEDGTTSYVISAGGSGIAAGDGVSITGGTMNVGLLSTGGISLSANKLTFNGNSYMDALAGTSGTPSSTNKYVTNDDTATAATASKVARRLAGGNITVVTETAGNNTTNAASTAYVDAAGASYKNGSSSRAADAASSTQNIAHGLGKIPKFVRIDGFVTGSNFYSYGSYDGATNCNMQSSSSPQSDSTYIQRYVNSTNEYNATVTVDATNIKIAWVKVNSGFASFTIYFKWEAYA
jgi:hypothetical protein